jgi:MFS family permease
MPAFESTASESQRRPTPSGDGVSGMVNVTAGATAQAGRAWLAVGILVLLYCMSIVDRYALSLLAEPIARALEITNTRLGVLFGIGFGLVYSIAGLGIAHLVDRQRRVPLLAAGVALWSLCTMLSGFANGFGELLLCRSGVAIGEAVLSPAAISIIGDSFPRDRRMLPTTVYTGASILILPLAFVIGGIAMDLGTHFSPALGLAPWRVAFALLGAPGIALALLLIATVREPARVLERHSEQYATGRQGAAYLWRQRALFGWMFVGMGVANICISSFIAWTPTLLIRAFATSPGDAGYLIGAFGVVASAVGVVTWPLLVKIWGASGQRDALVLLLAMGMCLTLGAIGIMGVSQSLWTVRCAICVVMFGMSAAVLLPPLIIQTAAPGRVRGRLIAINLMAATLIGLPVGPPLAALLAQALYTGAHALGYAMATMAAFATPVATAAALLMRKQYVIAFEEALVRESATA